MYKVVGAMNGMYQFSLAEEPSFTTVVITGDVVDIRGSFRCVTNPNVVNSWRDVTALVQEQSDLDPESVKAK